MAVPAEEDEDLTPEQYGDLNRQFFSEQHGPHVYLTRRMCGLNRQAASRRSEQEGSVRRSAAGEAHPDYCEDDPMYDVAERFAATDATVLSHPSSESLLRLYISMPNDEPCPWPAVARTRSPVACKEVRTTIARHRCNAGTRTVGPAVARSPDARSVPGRGLTSREQRATTRTRPVQATFPETACQKYGLESSSPRARVSVSQRGV